VRVVAVFDDGSSLEDVQLVGASGSVERVEVNLVEIFTVVLDREGTPVRDLERDEVSVRIANKPVRLERFGVAEELPLDLGLVIDTSQSMEVLMDDTRQAAVRFIADLVRSGDRAFVVDFDTKPRLAQPMTKNMKDLMKALGTLRAGGNTALFDSIVFSTTHFEDGAERRAIVLLTNGDDYQSRFSARQAWLQARSAGVPVYMISLAGMDWLRPAMKKDDLEAIAKETGGHVFYVSARPEIDTAYSRIGAELRSQYVLAFSTEKPLGDDEIAKLEVRVSRPNTTVRAVVAGRSVQTR
jgi:VWFA-related protein